MTTFNSLHRDAVDTTWSNVFTNTPLTAENLQRVVADMMSQTAHAINVQPDTIIMSPAVYEQWLLLILHDAERALKHALKIVSRAILSGRYGKRRRQIVDGVAAYRQQRRHDMAAELPQLHASVAKAQADLDDFRRQHHHNKETSE